MTQRMLITLDVESTGLDPATDRIISLAMRRRSVVRELKDQEDWQCHFNPGPAFTPLDPKVAEPTGLSSEILAGCPAFDDKAEEIHSWLNGHDLIGYNHINFDVPILWEELNRSGLRWNLDGVRLIDVGNVFKKKEQRNLAAAVRFYCGREMTDAHEAMADVHATDDVFLGQLDHYPDIAAMSLDELAAFCKMDDRVDLAGKIVRNEQGVPVYNIGKSKGVPVTEDPGFGEWMLGKDFSEQTKQVIRKLLGYL